MSADDNKRIQSIDSTETYAYWTNKEITRKKEEIKCINEIRHYKIWLTMTILQKER